MEKSKRRKKIKSINYMDIGFFASMPFNTKIAFISFLMAKFIFMPFSVLATLINPIIGIIILVLYALSVFTSIFFAVKQMMLDNKEIV